MLGWLLHARLPEICFNLNSNRILFVRGTIMHSTTYSETLITTKNRQRNSFKSEIKSNRMIRE